MARSYDEATGEWSALNEAFFTLDTVPADDSNLVVSKIHYNPADATEAELAIIGGDGVEADEFEFLELMNVGSETIDLNNVSISGGITFTFGLSNQLAPGDRILVVENRAAFEVRYASILNGLNFATDITGQSQYSGRLSNGGEQLTITDAAGSVIQSFTYDDSAPWPTVPDGGDYSLVLRNPGIPIPDHGEGTNWAASAEIGGSPGFSSEVGFVGDPTADLDGDGFSSLLEYALGSSDSQVGDTSLEVGFEDFLVDENNKTYLTISFTRNDHARNAVAIIPEVSNDLIAWGSLPDIVLVSEVDNGDDTSSLVYRSSTAVEDAPEDREFIRVRVVELP